MNEKHMLISLFILLNENYKTIKNQNGINTSIVLPKTAKADSAKEEQKKTLKGKEKKTIVSLALSSKNGQ